VDDVIHKQSESLSLSLSLSLFLSLSLSFSFSLTGALSLLPAVGQFVYATLVQLPGLSSSSLSSYLISHLSSCLLMLSLHLSRLSCLMMPLLFLSSRLSDVRFRSSAAGRDHAALCDGRGVGGGARGEEKEKENSFSSVELACCHRAARRGLSHCWPGGG
jgi:hypothetical protein